MAELLIWSESTSEDGLNALSALLHLELADYEVVFDKRRVLERAASRLAGSAYDRAEVARREAADRAVLRAPEFFDVVVLVAPVVTTAVVHAAVDAALRWLRGQRESWPGERAVVI
jgi:hypothetical protein